jgi:flagellar motor component MotA
MAWVALGSMLVFTVIMFTPLIPDSRIKLLTDLSNLFYLAQAGIVGAFMGFSVLDRTGVKK